MSDKERAQLRALQDRFLANPSIVAHIEKHGWDSRIVWHDSPTFAQVRDTILPKWAGWFRDFLND